MFVSEPVAAIEGDAVVTLPNTSKKFTALATGVTRRDSEPTVPPIEVVPTKTLAAVPAA